MSFEFIMPDLKLILFLVAGGVALSVIVKVEAGYWYRQPEVEVKAMSLCKEDGSHCPVWGNVYLILKLASIDSWINLFILLEFMNV